MASIMILSSNQRHFRKMVLPVTNIYNACVYKVLYNRKQKSLRMYFSNVYCVGSTLLKAIFVDPAEITLSTLKKIFKLKKNDVLSVKIVIVEGKWWLVKISSPLQVPSYSGPKLKQN